MNEFSKFQLRVPTEIGDVSSSSSSGSNGMTIAEFLNQYDKTLVDYDGAYGSQCVDLFRQFIKDVTGGTQPSAVDGAKDFALQDITGFNKLNSAEQLLTGAVFTGDVLVWGSTSSNKYGHIAIALGEQVDGQILVFEQNGYTQDGAKFALRERDNLLCIFRRSE